MMAMKLAMFMGDNVVLLRSMESRKLVAETRVLRWMFRKWELLFVMEKHITWCQ